MTGLHLIGTARLGAASVLVGVACGRGLYTAASVVVRLVGSQESLRLDLGAAEVRPCADALLGGPAFVGSTLQVRNLEGRVRVTFGGAPSVFLEATADVCGTMASLLRRRGDSCRAVAGEIGGAS